MKLTLFSAATWFLCLACTTETIRPAGHEDASVADSSNEAAPSCSADVPDACPTPMPSYTTDVVPILTTKCNGCHIGGDGSPWPLTNHDLVVHWRVQILSELARCTMPPLTSAMRISESERTTLIDWLVCGAPEN